ncbi:hypothetical protein [Algisphaera agarilytica]|uniref:Outer membrane lipoprotein-sorting protein n=1 Tax=Algisphaera agarilytica TaxID=1385975 RepID=A0A7X0LL10_9BACT|nr:hypothetical protein [Algisphaera agarilytica]MBB6430171.1 outer membrane lipoprotein-sorting protein [Algisphaera agarilytica]
MKWGALLLAAIAVLPGCVTTAPPLPAVEWDTLEDARQILIDRQNAIESVQAQLKLKITTPAPDEQTNTLDAALVIQGDDRFRMRAWKLNQTVFDLTATPDGTFIVANEEMKKQAPDAEQDLAKLTDQLGKLLRGPDYRQASMSLINPLLGSDVPTSESAIFATWPEGYTQINQRSLVPENSAFGSTNPSEPSVGVETNFSIYETLYWYQRVVVEGDFGTVEMTFRDVELNGELNPRAFKPSRRAVRIDTLDDEQAETMSP